MAIRIFRDLLNKHELDDRYSGKVFKLFFNVLSSVSTSMTSKIVRTSKSTGEERKICVLIFDR